MGLRVELRIDDLFACPPPEGLKILLRHPLIFYDIQITIEMAACSDTDQTKAHR